MARQWIFVSIGVEKGWKLKQLSPVVLAWFTLDCSDEESPERLTTQNQYLAFLTQICFQVYAEITLSNL